MACAKNALFPDQQSPVIDSLVFFFLKEKMYFVQGDKKTRLKSKSEALEKEKQLAAGRTVGHFVFRGVPPVFRLRPTSDKPVNLNVNVLQNFFDLLDDPHLSWVKVDANHWGWFKIDLSKRTVRYYDSWLPVRLSWVNKASKKLIANYKKIKKIQLKFLGLETTLPQQRDLQDSIMVLRYGYCLSKNLPLDSHLPENFWQLLAKLPSARRPAVPSHILQPKVSKKGVEWPGLEVRESSSKGMGVFTRYKLNTGTMIPILGKVFDGEQPGTQKTHAWQYYDIFPPQWIDGSPDLHPYKRVGNYGFSIAMMINEPAELEEQNCVFYANFVVLMKDIPKNTELLTYYGRDFPRTYFVDNDKLKEKQDILLDDFLQFKKPPRNLFQHFSIIKQWNHYLQNMP